MTIKLSKELENPIKQRALDSINETEESAYLKKQKSQAEYDFMFQQYEAICAKRNALLSQLKYNPNDKDLKAMYNKINSTAADAEINWSCASDRLQRDLSYYSKINNATFLANSQLA